MSQSKEVCAENLAHVLRRNHISFPAFVLEIPVKLITLDFPAFSSLIFISTLKSNFFFLFSSLLFVYWGFFSRKFYQILSGFGELTCSNSVLFDFRLEIGSVFIFFTCIEERETLCWKFICRIKTTRISVRQFVVSCSGGLDMFLWLNFLDDMRLHISSALFLHALRCFACSSALKNAAVYGIRARMILK